MKQTYGSEKLSNGASEKCSLSLDKSCTETKSVETRIIASRFFLFAAILFLGLFFGFSGKAEAATYYVNPVTGNDSNNITQAKVYATPVKNLAKLFSNNWIAWGDTIYLEAGNYNGVADTGGLFTSASKQIVLKNQVSGTPGILTVTNYPGDAVTIDMPTVAQTASGYLFDTYGTFVLGGASPSSKMTIINSQSSTAYIVSSMRNGMQITTTVQNAIIDRNNAESDFPFLVSATVSDYNPIWNFNRVEIKNTVSSSVNYPIFRSQPANGITVQLNFESCKIHDIGYLFNRLNGGLNVSMINNTIAKVKTAYFFGNQLDSSSVVMLKNNIFYGDTVFTQLIFSGGLSNMILTSNWTVGNNILYRPIITDPGSDADYLARSGGGPTELFPIDKSNYYVDPLFVDYGNNDYSIQAASKICGHGDVASLPANGDFNGSIFSNGSIGAFSCPSAVASMPTIIPDTVAFIGDSVAEGSGVQAAINGLLGSKTVVGSGILGAAIGGSSGDAAKWYVDRAAMTWAPQYLVFITYHNNFHEASNAPVNLTAQQAANDIEVAMEKAEYWGMTPIFLGMAGETGIDNITKSAAFNNAVKNMCISHNWSCESIVDYMQVNPNWNLATTSGGYYQAGGLAGGNVHPASQGYDLITRLTEYALYSKSTIGLVNINIGAGARVYADGKFRDLGTINTNTADLSVTPVGGVGSFNANDKSPWMDIMNLTWTNFGNHRKAWTESSTIGATNTLHAIGDLEANKNYNVSVDSNLGQNIEGANGTICAGGVCKSDNDGKISFLYTGGYSEHDFEVIEGDNVAPTTTANVNTGIYNTAQSVTLTCDDASGVGCDKTYYTLDGADPTTSSTQYSSTINIGVTATLKFFSTDLNGNSEEIQTKTYTISLPTENIQSQTEIKISSPKLFSNDNRKSFSTTLKLSKIKLKNTNLEIANGKVKIKKGSKTIKEISVDQDGKWSTSFSSKTFKVHYLNQDGTEIATSKEYKLKIDDEKPKIKTLSPLYIKHKGSIIDWDASDNKAIDYYVVTFGNKKYKVRKSQITVPASLKKGPQAFTVTAFDRAGNKSTEKGNLVVTW